MFQSLKALFFLYMHIFITRTTVVVEEVISETHGY